MIHGGSSQEVSQSETYRAMRHGKMTTTTMFSSPISRRSMIKFAIGAAAAVAVGGVALTPEADARSGGAYRTTTSLNFRDQPNTSSKVLAVIPKDTTVGYLGERQNGFLAVSYQ